VKDFQLSKKSIEEDLRTLASNIAKRTGKKVAKRLGERHTLTSKSSTTDLVTEIDEWSEKQITEYVTSRRPNDEIICEEGTYIKGKNNIRWFIDPIDGTTNFVYSHPGFSISVGVEIDKETKVGAIYAPLLNELFSASSSHGTTCNGREVEVSKTNELSNALIATGFSYKSEFRGTQAKNLIGILPKIRDIRRMGGAAFDLASVACGRVDAFFEHGLSPWDISAGHALVKNAGGIIMVINPSKSGDYSQPEVNVLKSSSEIYENSITVASSKHLIDQVVELLINSQIDYS